VQAVIGIPNGCISVPDAKYGVPSTPESRTDNLLRIVHRLQSDIFRHGSSSRRYQNNGDFRGKAVK